ncbi:hypothetical protein EIN_019130 [Entamoeba invadens IP1]|uniref:hypothetical protein n=1 Tax=Entamoeba invadens IP1 TaxID=370355 RepID=UPI0002C3E68B|nr:hypothetical protein EIN_019130 [Entamoeba invadens IP1]ELP90534.1 hypothetical protein EIN_019130 [Entamoeba invadens IP1]|eukprot:XP_004257305.1 hypothetical protein EIN_019130 [Entamoeba invadens IP1]
MLLVSLLLLFQFVNAVFDCSTIDRLDIPCAKEFTESTLLRLEADADETLSILICSHSTERPVEIEVFEECTSEGFQSLKDSYSSRTCKGSSSLKKEVTKGQHAYLNITIPENTTYEVSIQVVEINDKNFFKKYFKYFVIAAITIILCLWALLVAVIASRKHKKDSKKEEVLLH